jgi:hypothetical protein
MNKMMEQYFGYAGFGYQMFFIEPEAAQIVESNVCSSAPDVQGCRQLV